MPHQVPFSRCCRGERAAREAGLWRTQRSTHSPLATALNCQCTACQPQDHALQHWAPARAAANRGPCGPRARAAPHLLPVGEPLVLRQDREGKLINGMENGEKKPMNGRGEARRSAQSACPAHPAALGAGARTGCRQQPNRLLRDSRRAVAQNGRVSCVRPAGCITRIPCQAAPCALP